MRRGTQPSRTARRSICAGLHAASAIGPSPGCSISARVLDMPAVALEAATNVRVLARPSSAMAHPAMAVP
eukprot:3173723-Pyramimonas_sp.AAC.1